MRCPRAGRNSGSASPLPSPAAANCNGRRHRLDVGRRPRTTRHNRRKPIHSWGGAYRRRGGIRETNRVGSRTFHSRSPLPIENISPANHGHNTAGNRCGRLRLTSVPELRVAPSRLAVCSYVEMLDFLANNPSRHRIDIEADHIATNAVGLDQRGSASHEGVSDNSARKVIGAEECLAIRRSPNSERTSPRKSVPGRRANHLCTAMIGL